MSDVQYGKRSKWPIAAGFSLVLIALLFMSMKAISQRSAVISKDELVIYCAAGIKLPIMEITKAYTEEFGTPVRLELGSSGELEAKLLKDAKYGKTRAHLYIPADGSFSKRTSEKGLSFESLPWQDSIWFLELNQMTIQVLTVFVNYWTNKFLLLSVMKKPEPARRPWMV